MSQSLTNIFTIALNATQDARGQSADGSTKPELGNRVCVRVCNRRCAYSALGVGSLFRGTASVYSRVKLDGEPNRSRDTE